MSRGSCRYRGVVFDLDGTLIDTMPFVLEGLATVVAPYRARPTPEEVMGQLGGPSEACVRRLLGGTRHLARAHAAYLEYFRRRDRRARPFRGARALLAHLRAASVRIGLWTGRERDSTLVRLRALGWARWFEPVICGDDLDSHKPDPEGLLRIVRSWGLRPHQVLFAGDSDQDIEGGCAAGVPMLAIDHGRRISPGPLCQPIATVATPAAAFGWMWKHLLAVSPPPRPQGTKRERIRR